MFVSEIEKIPELLTIKEVCDILKVHPNTLRLWDKKGTLVAVRIGPRGDRRYKKEDVMKLTGASNG